MFESRLFAQDPNVGAIGQMLGGVEALLAVPPSGLDVAVAYASMMGCRTLSEALEKRRGWSTYKKRWLISIDFGRTEPAALECLAGLSESEVRIPHGELVLGRGGFFPQVTFHPKAYLARAGSRDGSGGAFVSSGNLTFSGLVGGTECGILQRWVSPLNPRERQMASEWQNTLQWFDNMWEAADPVGRILPRYKKLWRALARPPGNEDERVTSVYRGSPRAVTRGEEAMRFLRARALWVETGTLYKNRGLTQPGNQVDLQRGTRVFFGFPPTSVPRNRVLGEVLMRCEGFEPVIRTIRFGDNMMDKVNLPVPGNDGPASYDNSIVLFERQGRDADGRESFLVRIGTAKDLARWKRGEKDRFETAMHGGRKYGLMF